MKYFVRLDYFRAFLAWSVVISHLLDRVEIIHLEIGLYAVSGFFVLSGFIITHLLLKEFKQNNSIDLISFYKRRILRIWPLYFFYIFLCLSYAHFERVDLIWYYIFMIPNVAYVMESMIPFTNHYWSLGVEEQFYIFWPILLIFFNKRLFILSTSLIVFLFCFKFYCYFNSELLFEFFHATRFDLMALGGLTAFLYNSKYIYNLKHNQLIKRILYVFCFVILFIFVSNHFYIHKLINHFVFGVLSMVLILLLILDNHRIKYFGFIEQQGKISFGIYVYHSLILDIVINRIFKDFDHSKIEVQVTIIFVCITLIYLVSYLSFNYFEKYFNDLRTKLKRVH